MPTFVTLANWTDEGIRNIKDTPSAARLSKTGLGLGG
jgi:uncharacterized protein with GYD domain